jgi:hypothetical protein
MMIAKMMQVGNGPVILWIMLAVTQSFHFCTLEEYYIGGLFLGPFNGVTDGSAGIIGIFIATGITGNAFWATQATLPLVGALRVSQIVAMTVLVSQFVACALK